MPALTSKPVSNRTSDNHLKPSQPLSTSVAIPQEEESKIQPLTPLQDSVLEYWQSKRKPNWVLELNFLTEIGLPLAQILDSSDLEAGDLKPTAPNQDRLQYELTVCKAFAPHIEGFKGSQA